MFLSILLGSCKKLVQINEPTNSITATETFSTHDNVEAAIAGVYYSMTKGGGHLNIFNGGLTLYCGTSADDLVPFNTSGGQGAVAYIYPNTILTSDPTVYSSFWQPAYNYIYQANAIIEGVQASVGLSQIDKNQFIGEAKFLRALTYFYLVNIFGDIPYTTTSSYTVNELISRTAKDSVYKGIIADLQYAQNTLPADYALTSGDRVRANKWAATALLARAYLYKGDYIDAEKQSSIVIANTTLFSLNQDLNKVFLSALLGNSEAILQWLPNTTQSPYNATLEGINTIPSRVPRGILGYYASDRFLASIEPGDQRKIAWLDTFAYASKIYYFPFKFKIGYPQAVINTPPTEYPTVLRLAEQYLIRAEAEAHGAGSGLSGAITDLNTIRNRAGLPNLPANLNTSQVTAAVAKERRIEFFAEWGHRWFDLKRTGTIDSVMTVATPLKNGGSTWHSYQQLYPIPAFELKSDPNLTQNPGYAH